MADAADDQKKKGTHRHHHHKHKKRKHRKKHSIETTTEMDENIRVMREIHSILLPGFHPWRHENDGMDKPLHLQKRGVPDQPSSSSSTWMLLILLITSLVVVLRLFIEIRNRRRYLQSPRRPVEDNWKDDEVKKEAAIVEMLKKPSNQQMSTVSPKPSVVSRAVGPNPQSNQSSQTLSNKVSNETQTKSYTGPRSSLQSQTKTVNNTKTEERFSTASSSPKSSEGSVKSTRSGRIFDTILEMMEPSPTSSNFLGSPIISVDHLYIPTKTSGSLSLQDAAAITKSEVASKASRKVKVMLPPIPVLPTRTVSESSQFSSPKPSNKYTTSETSSSWTTLLSTEFHPENKEKQQAEEEARRDENQTFTIPLSSPSESSKKTTQATTMFFTTTQEEQEQEDKDLNFLRGRNRNKKTKAKLHKNKRRDFLSHIFESVFNKKKESTKKELALRKGTSVAFSSPTLKMKTTRQQPLDSGVQPQDQNGNEQDYKPPNFKLTEQSEKAAARLVGNNKHREVRIR